MKRRLGIALGVVAALVIVAGTAYAFTDNGIIHACVKDNGQVRIVEAATDCKDKDKETHIQWNVVGLPGPAGPQGLEGDTGPQGLQGIAGLAGADGAPGPAGEKGYKGDPGVDGADGAQGLQGLIGPTGLKGDTGQAGPAGGVGSQGPQGAQGPAGSGLASLDDLAGLPCGGDQGSGSTTLSYSESGDVQIGCIFPPPTPPPPRIAFITSSTYQGNFAGLEGMDQACQESAEAAGLQGTYMAWASSLQMNAAARLSHATVPYILTNGVRVADNWDDLIDSTLAVGINVDENGLSTTGATDNRAWTGTNSSGEYPFSQSCSGGVCIPILSDFIAACGNWTSSSSGMLGYIGRPDFLDPGWTFFEQLYCDHTARLYCLQQ